jgi:hypothetical protein
LGPFQGELVRVKGDKLIANLCDLGFDKATADGLCETDASRELRLNPPVIQPEFMN